MPFSGVTSRYSRTLATKTWLDPTGTGFVGSTGHQSPSQTSAQAWLSPTTVSLMAPCDVDPTHNRRAGAGYITVAVGRDYGDVAPVSGTFDGDGVMSALATRKQAVLAA